ncbi:Thiamine thiazole synthase [Methanosarcinaceae archaeon Ag5]|uniref:Digeranylgeranylglycerophospholipid reductase n=1 Tax=Methanolapillus africanus TaxID=3028297 RepID=A0AAE4MJP9_9EURY|nr:Thiamine thiazole synthase [Methanosarcinaceae archaeon Ag5]
MKSEYDVIVVGAGPAGSVAAKTVASAGFSVLLIEKRQEIGVSIRCAEGTSKTELLKFIDLNDEDAPDFICAELHKATVHAPDGTHFSITTKMSGIDGESGVILDRKIFDRHLAMLAGKAGADVYTKTAAIELIIETDGAVSGVKVSRLGNVFDVRSKIVIGADGVESLVARWFGLSESLRLKDIETGFQYLLWDETIDQTQCQVYLGEQVAPGGYVWVFPKGNNTANVGIGLLGSKTKEDDGRSVDFLDRFVQKEFPNAKIIGTAFGAVPVSGGLEKIAGNGVMIAGDAAGHSDPITGAGIRNAMYAGQMAGETAIRALAAGDFSERFLSSYQSEWEKTIGKGLRRNFKIKEAYATWTDDEINAIAKIAAGLPLEDFELKEAMIAVLKSDKKLLWKLRSVYADLIKSVLF